MIESVQTFSHLEEASVALSSNPQARFLAGGTLVMRAVNEGDRSFSTLVRTTDPSLKQVSASGSRIQLGAGVTMAQIVADPTLSDLHPAARSVGGPAVRAMATVGGNILAPSPYGDFTTALLALEATVACVSGSSQREIRLEELLQAPDRQSMGLVRSVSFERVPTHAGVFRYLKVSRVKPKGIALLSLAASLSLSGNRIQQARVAYNRMAPTPIRVAAVERALQGASLDDAGIAAALRVAAEGCTPETDSLATDWYRREVIGVYLKRLLLETEGRR